MDHRILVRVFGDEDMDVELGQIYLEEYYDLEQVITEVNRQFPNMLWNNIDIQIWRKKESAE